MSVEPSNPANGLGFTVITSNWNVDRVNLEGPQKHGINPYLISTKTIKLDGPSSLAETGSKNYTTLRINTNRQPYTQEFLVNGYGSLNMRLGTSLGS